MYRAVTGIGPPPPFPLEIKKPRRATNKTDRHPGRHRAPLPAKRDYGRYTAGKGQRRAPVD